MHVLLQRLGRATDVAQNVLHLHGGGGGDHFQVSVRRIEHDTHIRIERVQRGRKLGGVVVAGGQFELHVGFLRENGPGIGRQSMMQAASGIRLDAGQAIAILTRAKRGFHDTDRPDGE